MSRRRIAFLYRALAVWLVIILAETVHGALRVVFLEPAVGDMRARQITVFTGIPIILAIACLFIKWIRAAGDRELFLTGGLWLVLTVAFEISIGRLLGLSWARILEDYDLLNGGLMGFGLLFLLFAPLIAARLRGGFSPDSETDRQERRATRTGADPGRLRPSNSNAKSPPELSGGFPP